MSGDNPRNEFPPGGGQNPPPKDAGPAPPGTTNPYGDPSAQGPPPGLEMDKEARNLAMLAHLLGALFGFLGPLIIWMVKKDDSPFVDDQGKEALNFQLTLLIFHFVGWTLASVTCMILIPIPIVVLIFQLVFGIIGATTANKGEWYRYPMSIRMIK
ncbi:MAG: DUF4870 domain-containing protein [Pirellulaceae bacterium]